MSGKEKLGEGYYENLQRYPINDPALGGLLWSGNGSPCSTLSGWFVVDEVYYSYSELGDLKNEINIENN